MRSGPFSFFNSGFMADSSSLKSAFAGNLVPIVANRGTALAREPRKGGPTMDKVSEILLAALKQAMVEPGEQRLFKSGKLAGLFAGRTGVNAEAAEKALRD